MFITNVERDMNSADHHMRRRHAETVWKETWFRDRGRESTHATTVCRVTLGGPTAALRHTQQYPGGQILFSCASGYTQALLYNVGR